MWLGNGLSKQLFIGGCYEPNEMAFVNCFLKPGMVFIDAGAHEGLYTLLASRLVGATGRVYACEPSCREFERLQQNLTLNKIMNVVALRVALADYEGEGQLTIADSEHSGQNTLGRFAYQVSTLREERVSVRRLDDLAAEKRLTRVDLMKLDVEGAEGRLIDGGRKVISDLRPVVLFELADSSLSAQQGSARELRRLFRSLSYSIYSFDPETGWPVKERDGLVSANMVATPCGRSLPEPGAFDETV